MLHTNPLLPKCIDDFSLKWGREKVNRKSFDKKDFRLFVKKGYGVDKILDGLCIVVLFLLGKKEGYRHAQRQKFGNGDGTPDSVDAEEHRKQQYRGNLKQERAQEGNRCRDASVV